MEGQHHLIVVVEVDVGEGKNLFSIANLILHEKMVSFIYLFIFFLLSKIKRILLIQAYNFHTLFIVNNIFLKAIKMKIIFLNFKGIHKLYINMHKYHRGCTYLFTIQLNAI
jgi:hypothetical protein